VTLRVDGIPVLADDEIAADFISKLDPARYAQFLTELLKSVDNQASQHVFRNTDLLHNIAPITPYSLGGINSAGGVLTVSSAGSFRDLGGIEGTIGYAAGAAANVLSFAKLRDAGHWIGYHPHQEEWWLYGDEHIYVFARKKLLSGRMSSHYSCDVMATERVLVETVSENQLMWSRREVEEADRGRQLLKRLGTPQQRGLRTQ
jgi:hypothetical protein